MDADEKKVKRGLISDPSVPVPRLQRMPKRKQMADCSKKNIQNDTVTGPKHTHQTCLCLLCKKKKKKDFLTLQECGRHHLHVRRNIAIRLFVLCKNDLGG